MTRYLHITLSLVLGLFVLAGCQHDPVGGGQDPLRVTGEPVQVSLTLSFHGFGANSMHTKADYVDLDATLRYPYECDVVDYKVYAFEAKFKDEAGKFVLDRDATTLISGTEEIFAQRVDDSHSRVEFKIDDTYPSLAVLILANYGSYPSVSGSLQTVIEALQNPSNAVSFNKDQDKIVKGEAGVPMYGLQVFGDLSGMPSDAAEEAIKAVELKYYRNMSTPLTRRGFKDSGELANYTGTTGAVREEDRMTMRHALARLHMRYEPKTGQPAGLPKVAGEACVAIKSVKLHNYQDKVVVLPKLMDKQVTPFASPAADSLSHANSLQSSTDLVFVHPLGDPTASGDYSWVAYVPEQILVGDASANPYNDPYLIVEVEVTDKDGNAVTLTFKRDEIKREWKYEDPASPGTLLDAVANYKYSPWTEWLQMQNIDINRKKYKKNGDVYELTEVVPIGAYYHLVRNYSYEWIVEGVEGFTL